MADIEKEATDSPVVETNGFTSFTSSILFGKEFWGFNIFDYFSSEQVKDLIKDPIGNNDVLRKLSLMLYGTNGTYTNTVDYMAAMPTLDYVIVPHGRSKQKKKKNADLMDSTLAAIKHKEIVRDALFKGMVEGIAFYYFETVQRPYSRKKILTDYEVESIVEINDYDTNVSIISLPTDYTKIVGIKNSSYVIAFNLEYFDSVVGEARDKKLRKYPQEIRDAYLSDVNNSHRWVVLDYRKTIVHKIRSKRDERWGRPLVLAAINDILYNDYFTDTKRGVLDEINNKIVYQTFPEGQVKGTSALTKTQQQTQHERVRDAVLSKNNKGGISFFSVAAGTKIDSIDSANTDIFDQKNEAGLNEKIALDLGLASSLLNGVGAGSFSTAIQNLELVTAQILQWIEQIQNELNKCINANVIKDKSNRVDCKYLPITHVNKDKMVSYAKDLYLQGKGSLTLWASAVGITQDVFFSLLDSELEQNIENKYPVHQTSYTMSGKDEGGRPKTDNPTDKTVQSQQNNGNAIPSPSD